MRGLQVRCKITLGTSGRFFFVFYRLWVSGTEVLGYKRVTDLWYISFFTCDKGWCDKGWWNLGAMTMEINFEMSEMLFQPTCTGRAQLKVEDLSSRLLLCTNVLIIIKYLWVQWLELLPRYAAVARMGMTLAIRKEIKQIILWNLPIKLLCPFLIYLTLLIYPEMWGRGGAQKAQG